MTGVEVLRSMVLSFRVAELHTLLTFAGKSRSGRKSELQKRALELVEIGSADIKLKIRDLSNAMYKSLGTSPSINPYSANFTSPASPTLGTPPVTAEAAKNSGIAVSSKSASNGNSKATPKSTSNGSNIGGGGGKTKTPTKARVVSSDEDDDEDEDDEDEDQDEEEEVSSSSASSRSSSPVPVKSKKKPPKKAASPPPLPPEAVVSPVTGRAGRRAAMVAYASVTDICKETEREQEQEILRHEKAFRKSSGKDKGKEKSKEKEKEKNKDNSATITTTGVSRVTTAPVTPPASDTEIVTTTPVLPQQGRLGATNLVTPPTAPYQRTPLNIPSVGPSSRASTTDAAAPPTSGTTSTAGGPTPPGGNYQLPFPRPYASSVPAATRSIFTPMPSASTYSSLLSAATAASGTNVSSDSKLMYPPFPDVKLQKLPFYKVLATLLKPSALQPVNQARFQEQKFHFYLSPHQAGEILESGFRDSNGRPDYRRQIQMRFSLLETSCEQEDNFPSSICVKVNHKMQPLPNPIPTNKPGVEPKRPPKPINITSLCKLSATLANYIDVSWAVEIGKGFTMSVYYVDKLTTRDLMKELKARGTRLPDFTHALIKEKLNDKDSDISTTSCKVTLACPLGKMRMTYPCRANSCDHLQCFDANLYLMMNERKPKWLCPVCNNPAPYDNLLIDGYFTEMLSSNRLPEDEHEIVLHNDGTWDPMPPPAREGEENGGRGGGGPRAERRTVAEKIQASSAKASSAPSAATASTSSGDATKKGSGDKKVETFSVDDDSDDSNSNKGNKNAAAEDFHTGKRPIDCITLDSEESDSEDVPSSRASASKRPRTTAFLDSDSGSRGGGGASEAEGQRPAKRTTAGGGASADEEDIICLDDD